jgi:hypothetical protein
MRGLNRNHRKVVPLLKVVWKSTLPLKLNLFLWKLVNGLLPLDGILQNLGYKLASKCSLCSSHQESLLHSLLPAL